MGKGGYAVLLLPIIKKQTEMEVKVVSAMLYLLGIPGWIYALYINLGTWKSDVMFGASLLIMGFHAYWRWRRNLRADRKADQEERMREIEMREREKGINK
jgi:hypothetical protein